jgi:hypothetical protein
MPDTQFRLTKCKDSPPPSDPWVTPQCPIRRVVSAGSSGAETGRTLHGGKGAFCAAQRAIRLHGRPKHALERGRCGRAKVLSKEQLTIAKDSRNLPAGRIFIAAVSDLRGGKSCVRLQSCVFV